MSPLPAVLLVEDNSDDEALLREAFRRASVRHPLVVARDGAEALDKAFALSVREQPALVVLDLKLPRLSGLEVLRRLRSDAATMTVPVVVLSSSAEPSDVEQCYACGANSFLVKPPDFASLETLARELAIYWLKHNESPRQGQA